VAELFLDTTILVDRVIAENDPAKITRINALLAGFEYLLACTYSRLEFKRVIIQNLGLILRYLCEERSFFRAFHKAAKLQRQRRTTTLVNVLAWLGYKAGSQLEVIPGDALDSRLAMQGESYIRNGMRYLWTRFEKSVHSTLDGTKCVRSTEGPRLLRNGDFDVSIPESRCRQKECNNANFLRSALPTVKGLCAALEDMNNKGRQLTLELEKARATLRAIEKNLEKAYDYKTCLAIGDVWIHLEAQKGGAKNFATTNRKESAILCPILGLSMKQP
jgi:hypothetical protein